MAIAAILTSEAPGVAAECLANTTDLYTTYEPPPIIISALKLADASLFASFHSAHHVFNARHGRKCPRKIPQNLRYYYGDFCESVAAAGEFYHILFRQKLRYFLTDIRYQRAFLLSSSILTFVMQAMMLIEALARFLLWDIIDI